MSERSDTPRTEYLVKHHCSEYHAIQLCRQLERELAEVRKDAERWRHVRENIQIGSGAGGMDMWKIILPDPGIELEVNKVFTAAIDAAIAKETK